jgi:hypothetical protein
LPRKVGHATGSPPAFVSEALKEVER